MTEPDRFARNLARLGQCHPAMKAKLEIVLERLELEAFRPRIQHAWRSVEEQRSLRAAGTSKLSWGYHNCTAIDGTPESLAADVLDDDAPLTPSLKYVIRLGALAREEGLSTGVDWGLPPPLRLAVRLAMTTGVIPDGLKVGWDSAHVEWVGISVRAAHAGTRPFREQAVA